jgi:putative FmdB family regulatory protein
MPTYEYQCKECGNRFDKFCKMDERENPTKLPCSECGENAVKQGFFTAPVGGYDTNLKPQAGFGELMNSIKNNGSVPKRFHDKLDRAADRRGGRYNTQ